MKLNEWLDIWLTKYVKHAVKTKTLYNYGQIAKNHIVPFLGDYDLEELTPLVLQDFLVNLLERGNIKTGGPLANNSVNVVLNVLKHAISKANFFGVTQTDFSRFIRAPFMLPSKVTAFERSEQEKLEKYCLSNKKQNYLGVVICLYTGLRIGELLALTWEDIDLKSGIMTISKTAYQMRLNGKLTICVDTPKTKTSNREIPLPNCILGVLRVAKKKSKSQFVITTKNNTMVGTRSYQKTFELIQKKLGIPRKNFHALRHTFATRALEIGMDVKTVAEILGHKNPIITLSRYAHSLMSHKRSMMNKLGKNMVV